VNNKCVNQVLINHSCIVGKSTVTELWRNGEFVKEIFRQDNYDYNQPIIVRLVRDNHVLAHSSNHSMMVQVTGTSSVLIGCIDT
jgi:hypothetical protein